MVRKGLKPNVSEKRVKGRDGKIRVYYFYRTTTDGKEKYIKIPFEPDSPEFDRQYWEIRSGKHTGHVTKTTFDILIESYLRSHKYLSKADGTKRKYRPVLEHIREQNGKKDFTKMRRRDVIAAQEHFSDTPRKADSFVQILSILFNHAIDLEMMKYNPAKGVKLYGSQKKIEPWPKAKQDAYERYCKKHNLKIELLAYYLGTGTGQRPGDLIKMKWEHFDGEFMLVVQEKTSTRIRVYCPTRLRSALAEVSKQGDYILAKNLREPLTYNQLQKRVMMVRRAVDAADYSMHGWRFTAAVELAEAGASDSEIQAVTGHKTLEMVQKYRAQANQRLLSKSGQQRRDND